MNTCVVGAGPAGLAMTRALMRHGLDFDCFERHHDVGGIWDQPVGNDPVSFASARLPCGSGKAQCHKPPLTS
jgi:cation diffusion facilitator CzcD-associated flavoprotein CzcO